jgi:light-regulated signal transduction histidine kinase (bacteriophytochrome)
MSVPLESNSLDISSCEKEPIHIIGSVQPHGALLVLSEPELEILQASLNSTSVMACDGEVLGRAVDGLFSSSSVAKIKQVLTQHGEEDFWPAEPVSVDVIASNKQLQGLLHRYKGACILELENQVHPSLEDLTNIKSWISVHLMQLFKCVTVPQLLQLAVKEIQRICGFDRVLIYQFDSDWHGSVEAECGRDFMPSFIHHHFPASDIPQQARDLYAKNLLRFLVDVDATPSPIMPAANPRTGAPVDLSYSILRSMSPIHIEYLKNMEVTASMSLSLMVKDKLWGLIACHHKTPRTVDFAARAKCELVARLVSDLIEKIDETEIAKERLRLRLEQAKIVGTLSKADNVADSHCQQVPDLLSIANANGFALVGEEFCELFGGTPSEAVVRQMVYWLSYVVREPLFACDKLALEYPQWSEVAATASGLLAIDISSQKSLWILWFRPEQVEEILWAGNPNKPVEIVSNHEFFHPRKSFQLWKESVHGYCRPWTAVELESAASLQKDVFALTLAEILRTEKTRKILNKQRQEVLSILVHDMNAPVAGMDRVLSSLVDDRSDKIPPKLRETLQVLLVANRKHLMRIRKLLHVLTYELNNIEFFATQIDCAEIVHGAIKEVAPLRAENTAQFVVNVKEVNKSFRSDPESVRRLLVNLLDNALRVCEHDGIIEVSCETSEVGLSIQVADNGPGIAVEDQKHLFDSFWQGGILQPYSPNVGMGLYLCRRIVEALGGTISCQSELGKGATFTVLLPSL